MKRQDSNKMHINLEIDRYLKKLYSSDDYKIFAHELYEGESFMYNVPHTVDGVMIEKGLIKTYGDNRILTSLGINISETGGWLVYQGRIIETHKEDQRKTDLEFEKLKHDLRISKFQSRTQWWPLIISIISLFTSIYAVFKAEIDLFIQKFSNQ